VSGRQDRSPGGRFLGEPIRLHEVSNGQVRRVYRASLLAASSVTQTLAQEAGLRLQWELEQGTSLEVRLRGLVVVLGWLARELGTGQADCEVGIHEPDLRYYVDRLSWRGI
jgi:hypothetical protein